MRRSHFQLPGFLFVLISFLIFSCSGGEKPTAQKNKNAGNGTSANYLHNLNVDEYLPIDLDQDLSNKSLQELRILRNSLYARQGFLFMQADLRGYFSSTTKWYDTLMESRFWSQENEDNAYPPIQLSAKEQAFLKKIQALEKKKLAENFISRNGRKLANADNIINLFQFKDIDHDFMAKLRDNNFVIIPDNHIQLFHLYEENDYKQVPNFVTTDLYLQLLNMYFAYLTKSLEQEKFIPALTTLTEAMHKESIKIASSAGTNEKLKNLAEYNAVFFAIPHTLLTNKQLQVPQKYQALYKEEIEKANSAKDATSDFLDVKEAFFPYSLFTPRGNYTRSDEMKRYFKAMMWLQLAPFCRDKHQQLLQATFMASLLQSGKTADGKSLSELYKSIYGPIVFLIGEPDNLSVMDIYDFLQKSGIEQASAAIQPGFLEKVSTEMIAVAKNRNRIKPKIEVTCPDKINFMPQRYLVDNEIMQELVDVNRNAKRAYPKGLDVFAAFGDRNAENILLNMYEEDKNWNKYTEKLQGLKKKFANYKDWDKSVYNKWLESLVALQRKNDQYPPFMQTPEWSKKNLNTGLASWAELKHNAILYGEQPFGAECGGGGPPAPITVGYVEPNINFWTKSVELFTLTEQMLKKHQLLTEDIESKTKSLKENATFLLTASRKELKKEKLTEQEYNSIEVIGSSIEYLTLSIVEPQKHLDSWEDVKGPDKEVAVVADVYTRNIAGDDKNGILHVATGKVNSIYVIAEIEDYLYLTKGAVFSYYEFPQPLNKRLTDEDWQKMLEEKKAPPIPKWMEDIILPDKKKPIADEKIFYSSGC